MEKLLKLYTFVDGVNDTPFPNEETQIEIPEFLYTATRMSGAPMITATLMHNECLDNVWTESVYALFNDEKYYLKQVPTSSFDNTEEMYKHSLELVSERKALDDVYFFDVVTSDYEGDKPCSNSSSVTFFGSIYEFAERLNYSLQYSNLQTLNPDGSYKSGYKVEVAEDLSTEGKLMSFENQFISNVLQEIYNTYNIPYCFEGKTIKIGKDEGQEINHTFRYGSNDALLSITKTNANYKIVNRVTGTGSSENIPYYYPNETPLGQIQFNLGTNCSFTADKLSIINADKFGGASILDKPITYSQVSVTRDNIDINYQLRLLQEYDEYGIEVWRNIDFNDANLFYTLSQSSSFKLVAIIDTNDVDNAVIWNSWSWRFEDETLIEKLDFYVKDVLVGIDGGMPVSVNKFDTYREGFEYFDEFLGDTKKGSFTSGVLVPLETGKYHSYEINVIVYPQRRETHNSDTEDKISFDINFYVNSQFSNIKQDIIYGWYDESNKQYNLENIGLKLDATPIVGDSFTAISTSYIKPTQSLMPSIYRQTVGGDRFYNALNNTYIKEDGEYYTFPNPYVVGKPKEHIVQVEDIRPTIEKMVNAAGLRIDMFSEFAFDQNDSDETEEIEGTLYYKHPYFFGKLRKFDGEHGFNLFDHAIENDEMKISMTSGSCGACNFTIGVWEDDSGKQWNIVQVDDDGNLLYDSNGNVRCGREHYQSKEEPQERQNNTKEYEVWIALKKEEDTFGVIMPNATFNYKPQAEDTFVITNIHLPNAYITNAESLLTQELIKYMYDNNSEKFNFTITLSRIFFEENPTILANLNENSKLIVEYNNNTYPLYVNSFSYNMSRTESLPEIKVELTDTLTIAQNALQNSISEVKRSVFNAINSIDVLKIASEEFIKKSEEDEAVRKIKFKDGLEVGAYTQGEGGVGASINIDENGLSYIEADYLNIRKKAIFHNITIQELNHIGGELILSPAAMVCYSVKEYESFYRCYFKNKDSNGQEIPNEFQVGDQARCEIFNTKGRKFYWRLVVSVGEDFIDLSKTDCADNSDIPYAGDKISQLGNRTDTARQSAIFLSSVNEYSPRQVLYSGVNSYSLEDKEYIDFGVNKEINKAFLKVFGESYIGARDESEYIKYENGKVSIKGSLEVGTKLGGKDLEQMIAEATPDGYDEFVEQVVSDLASLQQQIDGAIESYFYEYEPTLENYPASGWSNDDEKAAHLNDTFTNLSDGRSWRWSLNNGVYSWVEITDTATTEALRLAGQAQDTADGKRRVFITQPTPPYDLGDLWAGGSDVPLRRCINSKASGSFDASDWDYADNTQSQIAGLDYLKKALSESTLIDGGLIQSSILALGYTDDNGVFHIMSGTSGIYDTTQKGNGIAAWYGGAMVDKEVDTDATDFAKTLFRHDGSGYIAGANISWNKEGIVSFANEIKIGTGDDTLGSVLNSIATIKRDYLPLTGGTISGILRVQGALVVPTTAPDGIDEGEWAFYLDESGTGGETPSGGGSGVDEEELWSILATDDSSKLIHSSHIPTLGISKISGLQNALNNKAEASALSSYLPKSGGTIGNGVSGVALTIDRASTNPTTIKFNSNGSLLGYIGFDTEKNAIINVNNGIYNLIHSGNIGSQSVNYATTAGSAKASDVYSWAKASSKPSYTTTEVSEGSNLYFTNARAISACDGTYLKLSGGTLQNNNSDFLTIKRVGGGNPYITFYSDSAFLGRYGFSTSGEPIAIVNSALRTFYHTGNFNPANYLPLSGGTINGAGDYTYSPLWVNSGVTSMTGIDMLVKGNAKAHIGWSSSVGVRLHNSNGKNGLSVKDDGTPTYYTNDGSTLNTLLHSGNYSSYALPLSGGTLTAYDSPLALASTSARVFQVFKVGSSNKGSIGYANGLMYIGNDAGNYARIGVNDSGIPQYWSNNNASTAQTLIHSGNIGSQSVSYATSAGNANNLFSGSNIGDANTTSFTDHALRWFSAVPSTTSNIPTYTGYQNGLLALPLHSNGCTAQLYFSRHRNLYYRSNQESEWNKIAYVTDNVASATKLQTARNIWGNSFDGTKNIGDSGNSEWIFLNYGGNGIYISGSGISYHDSSNGWVASNISCLSDGSVRLAESGGNVLIGTTDDNGTKLQVKGNIDLWKSSGYGGVIGLNRKSSTGGLYNTSCHGWQIHNNSGNLQFFVERTNSSVATPIHIVGNNGNVLIGTTTDWGFRLAVTAIGSTPSDVGSLGSTSGAYFGNITEGYGTAIWTTGDGKGHIQQGRSNGAATAYNLCLQELGGNVLIGTTNNSSSKLYVNGDIEVKGLIIPTAPPSSPQSGKYYFYMA